jgi:hypothetical protein
MTIADIVVLSEDVSHRLSFAIGGGALLLLLGLAAALIAFGAGREHS